MGASPHCQLCGGSAGTRRGIQLGLGPVMAVVPDTKDWTWVLERRCPECGFDTRTVTKENLPLLLRDNAQNWQRVIGDAGTAVAIRPREDRWSVLEYACHVRDVFEIFDQRLALMLQEDDPRFPNWDQDATAVERRYGAQAAPKVSEQLSFAAAKIADRFAGVTAGQWSRTGTRGDGARFTVETLGRYLMHDPVHHLHDVGGPRR
jgi:DinB superfamily